MAPARIAVVGAGLIGRKHIEVLRSPSPDYTLAWVADPAPSAMAEAEALGYVCYADFAQMLDREKPDGVVIAVPNQLHVSTGLACVSRGIPILIEKPVAGSVGEALTLIEAAEKANVATLVGHHRRHNPIMRRAADIVREGGVGRVVAATAMYLSHKPKDYHDATWRREPGGGPVLLNAIHDIDCLRMIVGDIESVQAIDSRAVRGFAVEDTAAAVLRFKNGALGTLVCSDTASTPWSWEWGSRENPSFPYEPESCFNIAGTLGSLSVPTLLHRWHEKGNEHWHVPLTQKRHPVKPADAYVEQMRNFAGVIRGTEAPVLSGREGTLTLATTLAISLAAQSRAPVEIDALIAGASAGRLEAKSTMGRKG
jgi:predicted dehydrogenase